MRRHSVHNKAHAVPTQEVEKTHLSPFTLHRLPLGSRCYDIGMTHPKPRRCSIAKAKGSAMSIHNRRHLVSSPLQVFCSGARFRSVLFWWQDTRIGQDIRLTPRKRSIRRARQRMRQAGRKGLAGLLIAGMHVTVIACRDCRYHRPAQGTPRQNAR